MPPKTSFLDRTSLAPGAFAKQSRVNERLVQGLSEELDPPIRTAFQLEAKSTSQTWVDDAVGAIRALLGESAAMAKFAKQSGPEAARMAQFLEGKLDSGARSRELDDEVKSASERLAQQIVSLWLEALHRALAPAHGAWAGPIDLNAEMLPGDVSARELIASVGIAEYAISVRDAIEAWAAYRQDLTDEAERQGEPIQLGPRMFAYPDSRREGGEFRLFADQADAKAFAEADTARLDGSGPPAWSGLRPSFTRAYGQICMAVAHEQPPAADREEIKRLVAYATSPAGKRIAVSFKRTKVRVNMTGADQEMAKLVTISVRALKRGSIVGPKRAETYLVNEVDAYAARLRRFAKAAGVTPEVACMVYRTSVDAALWSAAPSEGKALAGAVDPSKLFSKVENDAERQRLSQAAAVAFRCGMAYIDPN